MFFFKTQKILTEESLQDIMTGRSLLSSIILISNLNYYNISAYMTAE